jgi:hypothetical protein
MKIALPKIPQRHHRALFDRDLPFRGRKEQRKDLYQRQPKHREFIGCKVL